MSNRKSKTERRESRRSSASGPQEKSQPSRLKAILIRALFFGAFTLILGFAMFLYRKYVDPPRPLHSFSSSERNTFVDMLKTGPAPTQSVWLSCPEGKAETCRLVKQFVEFFNEAGWRVEGNQVVQWKPAHPLEGVYLILQAAGEPDALTRATEKRIRSSFTAIGIPVRSASAPDLPKNSIGIYFGPDL